MEISIVHSERSPVFTLTTGMCNGTISLASLGIVAEKCAARFTAGGLFLSAGIAHKKTDSHSRDLQTCYQRFPLLDIILNCGSGKRIIFQPFGIIGDAKFPAADA